MMTWSLGLFLGMVLFFQSDVLVLKNGRKMLCETYTVANGRVTIQAKGQTFSLPESAIDWNASESATQSLAREKQAAREKAEREAQAKKEWRLEQIRALEAAREKGTLSLTTRDLRKTSGAVPSGPIEVNFRMLSNSIIVAMHINGQGPFDFVLDTGASVTMIDPHVLNQANIPTDGPTVNVVGVGGRPVQAPICKLEKLALGQAVVQGMDAVSHRIDHLFRTNIYGLIGQDFLNHFVMNLDAANKTLTLTPQFEGQREMVSKSQSGAKYDHDHARSLMRDALRTMESEYRQLGQERDGATINDSVRKLRKVSSQIRDIKQQLRYQKSYLESLLDEQLAKDERDKIQGILGCYSRLDLAVDHLLVFNRTLTQAANQPKPSARLMADVEHNADRARESDKNFSDCYEQIPR